MLKNRSERYLFHAHPLRTFNFSKGASVLMSANDICFAREVTSIFGVLAPKFPVAAFLLVSPHDVLYSREITAVLRILALNLPKGANNLM